MKKLFPVLFLIISFQSFGQPNYLRNNNEDGEHPFSKQIYTRTLVFPGDTIAVIYFLYKIPYQNLVFLKNGNDYKCELRFDIEITDTNSVFVKREIKSWKINASSYEQTNSPDFFAEGYVKLNLSPGVYLIQPIMTDQVSEKEFKLKNEKLIIGIDINPQPLIVNSNKFLCDDQEYYSLVNFEGNILFNSENQSVIIPVADNSIEEINISVLSREDTIANQNINESFISAINLYECSGRILITNGGNIKTKNFILNNISGKLKEGPFTIIINNERFTRHVTWYNKPKSLFFPEIAINALKHIEETSVIDSLLDLDDDLQYDGLVDYWKNMDPSPDTEYNELMNEFYSRVDYAQQNFSSLTGIRGVETDRGKIFIKFGKPDQVERSSNEKGKIVETWIYFKSHQKFVFVDKQGVGEFSLESS